MPSISDLGIPIKNAKQYLQTAGVLALLLTAFLVPWFAAQAVDTSGLFELGDGAATPGSADILGTAAQDGPDWADIFDANGDVVNLFGGEVASFIKDETSQAGAVDSTTYAGAGGSNKNSDPDIAADWGWDAGNVPAKDDLSNVYAYAIVDPATGHLVIYAGFERIDSSGDSHIDIELFHQTIGLDEEIPCDDPGRDPTPCHFVGQRTVGDIIISMDFTIGGDFGSLEIRTWDGSEYVLAPGGTLGNEGCNPLDTICGFNNGANINGGPWPNFDRHGAEIPDDTGLPRNAFTEFGFDLTALGVSPCLSSILGKTRSSQSFTAELKDFAGPTPFALCTLRWFKVDNTGQALGGATFQVCRTHSFDLATSSFVDIPDECSDVVDDTDGVVGPGLDKDPDAGEFLLTNLNLGRYTVQETVAPPGFEPDPRIVTEEVTPDELNAVIPFPGDTGQPFTNIRPVLKITEFGYTNTPTLPVTEGVVSGTATYTVRLHNFAGANAILTGSSLTITTDASAGTVTCDVGPSCVLALTGTAVESVDLVFHLTVTYSDLNDGAKIQADLVVFYVTISGGDPRQASGSPATIIFTIQSD